MRHVRIEAARRRLQRRLKRVGRVFDLQAVAGDDADAARVVAYFHQNFHPYRRYHSQEGSLHLALNPGGRFQRDGYYGQARAIEALWQQHPPRDVLELAFGKGLNLAYLAPRWPQVALSGIDLTPRHVKHARTLPALAGARLAVGDLHAPAFADASFDTIYCIEGFCYATDLQRALDAQARLLRPGGLLVLFDGYRTRAVETMLPEEALAVRAVERSMAVQAFQDLDVLKATATAAGLALLHDIDLSAAVLPNMRRLERIADLFLLVPPLARRWPAGRSSERGRNLVAAALGRTTSELGLHTYRQLVFRKPA